MNGWICFILGLIIGSILGMLVFALVCANKEDDKSSNDMHNKFTEDK